MAGTLSVLSPCVLPLLPVLFVGAGTADRFGIIFLTAGLTLSFTAISLFVATLGFVLGIDGQLFQFLSASLLIAVGTVLVMPRLQSQFASLLNPVRALLEQKAHGLAATGPCGQFGLGVLLGGAWTPCTGPTLGAAALMAATRHDGAEAGFIMLVFALGAALPLLFLGQISRATFSRWRSLLATTGRHGRMLLGFVLIVFGLMSVTGTDQRIETILLSHQPTWLIALTTRY